MYHRTSSVAAYAKYQLVNSDVIFEVAALEKTSRPGNVRCKLKCPGGTHHQPLSLSNCLVEYSQHTQFKRAHYALVKGTPPNRLFISNMKSFQSVKPCTLAKWLLTAMAEAGIDTDSYKAHSAHLATTTGMLRRGLSLQQVLKRANWSPTSHTFALFYNRL